MPCYFPLQAYTYNGVLSDSGKKIIHFGDIPVGSTEGVASEMRLPCGKCIGCRLERSRQWAVRLMHENKCHEVSSFLTLTYADKFLPVNRSLDVRDFQLFMKRLRKRYPDNGIRFFHCGEYSPEEKRPHYHACVFSYYPTDVKFHKYSKSGFPIYISESLDELWGKGHCYVGDVSFESAAYVARYIVDKVVGDKAEAHYAGRLPEYVTMSRRPGISKLWLDKFIGDVYPRDSVIVNGGEQRAPAYYDHILELSSKGLYDEIKAAREEERKNAKHKRRDELKFGEIVKRASLNIFKRK